VTGPAGGSSAAAKVTESMASSPVRLPSGVPGEQYFATGNLCWADGAHTTGCCLSRPVGPLGLCRAHYRALVGAEPDGGWDSHLPPGGPHRPGRDLAQAS